LHVLFRLASMHVLGAILTNAALGSSQMRTSVHQYHIQAPTMLQRIVVPICESPSEGMLRGAMPARLRGRRAGRCVAEEQGQPPPPPPVPKTVRDALDAAEKRLAEAPYSWADLANPRKEPEPPEVPALLSLAPAILGVFSVILFVLNTFGVFGEGPDLDKLAEDIANIQ